MPNSVLQFFVICFFLLTGISCLNLDDPIDNYYSDSKNIVGGLKPSAPHMNEPEYLIDGIYLSWGPSIDPDTQDAVPIYFLYVCPFEPKSAQQVFSCPYVANQNYFIEPRRYKIPSNAAAGTYYFAATGYDSLETGRESDPSNVVSVTVE